MEKRTVETVSRRLEGFYRDHRRMPAYSEMIPLLGVRSKSVVHFWMRKLMKEGVLEKDPKGLLRPVRRDFALPLVGAIQAGFPTPSEEELRDLVSIDEYLVTKPEACFLLRVSGDSMTGEGIMPGDLVIVERGREPRAGDVVVAQVDGEWTMKYFTRTKGGAVVLESANPRYPPIRAREELKIAGIVSAVVRKYICRLVTGGASRRRRNHEKYFP